MAVSILPLVLLFLGILLVVLVGLGIALWVLLRRRKEPRGFEVLPKKS